MDLISQPFAFLIHWLYQLTGNLGWSIILLTVIIRTAFLPLTLPSLRSQKRIRALQPEIQKLRAQHGKDAAAFGQAQMALYKEHEINPLAGCLPTLVQIGLLFVLYNVLRQFIGEGQQGLVENVLFFGVDLTVPDRTFILPILAAALQLILSVMLLPGLESHDLYPEKSDSKKVRDLNDKETQQQDMAAMMQKQMTFVFPVMTGIMAASFPAGLGVYWTVSTAYSLIQQYFISGWGGLAKYLPENIRSFGPQVQPVVLDKPHKKKGSAESSVSRAETLKKIATNGSQGGENAFAAAFAKLAQSGEEGNEPAQSSKNVKKIARTSSAKRKKKRVSKKRRQ